MTRTKGSRNLKTKKSEAYQVAKAAEKGKLQAISEDRRKHANKFDLTNLWSSISEHIGKAVDRIDPFETAAVLGATVIIKNGLDWAQPAASALLKSFLIPRITELQTLLRLIYPPKEAGGGDVGYTPPTKPKGVAIDPDTLEWIISFVLAYIIVKYFGNIMQTVGNVGSGILGLANNLIGLSVLAA